MGFIQSTFFGLVLLCAFGSVILQETTSEPPITTSTIASTTTETPTSETTSKPTDPPTTLPPSTTTVPASTTPKPPLPEVGSWNISDGNVTCIRAELQIGFNIILGGVEESFVLSPNASDSGSECQAPNGTQAKVGNSFRCKTTDTILMGNATMQVYYIHIQAFGTAEDNGFNTAEECEADDKVSDIIPIAVGCALAALIIIVLIAYLVGRRRSRQKGYTSV
ncbi:hypothetical protein HNY73_003989 [Argiope bruennichi]|uniref:Lysosome-associated membrane glycoprotein 2-like transmembrane domain-containing protein n=1 Tax=Argiope bruennichi TaxID=94029 RepID=A0A8T0FNA0_ARGBR|nr:hypothetical protein HNY73_003989 [Argiope bruennichi]